MNKSAAKSALIRTKPIANVCLMKPMPSDAQCVIKFPTEAEVLRAYGDQVTILLGPAETGGAFTMFETITQPGGGPPPHYHLNEDECFYVVEGKAEFFKDGAWTEVPVGSAVYIPKGAVHTFRNAGTTPLRQVIRTSPSGFEKFFAASAVEFAKPGGPNMESLMTIAASHGIHFVMD